MGKPAGSDITSKGNTLTVDDDLVPPRRLFSLGRIRENNYHAFHAQVVMK
jgi:hypothetical protein